VYYDNLRQVLTTYAALYYNKGTIFGGGIIIKRKIRLAAAAALTVAVITALGSCAFLDQLLSILSGRKENSNEMKTNGFESIEICMYADEAGTRSYKAEKTEKGATLSYYQGLWEFFDDVEQEDCLKQRVVGGEELYKRVLELANTYKIKNWDGFSESDNEVLDGSSFNFYATLDGENIYAHGSNAFPEGFNEFRDALWDILQGNDESAYPDSALVPAAP